MTTAYAYLRVSGDAQADRGVPIAGQREAVQAHADAHGLHIVRWFVDEARPGSDDHRDAFQEMMRLAHVTPSPVTAILLWSWSRFSRDQNDAHYWKASLRRHGVEIRDVSGETPVVEGFEYVLESLIHWRDEQRLHEISRDARRGQQALVQRGYVPSGCRPPRGYRVEIEEIEVEGRRRKVRRWVPDPQTWPLVERAWQMRLQGRSYRDILRECPGLYRSPNCLTTFFGNPIYKGELRFGGAIIEVEAVVTPEEWAQVNRNRGKRESGAYARRQGGTYLLTGLLRCGRCGRALVGHRTSGARRGDGYEREPWEGYRCPGRRNDSCDLPFVTGHAIERAVIEALLDDVLRPEYLAQCLEDLLAAQEAERPALEARVEALGRQIGAVDDAIERLLVAIEAGGDAEPLVARLRGRQAERDGLGAQLQEARERLDGHQRDLPDLDALRRELEEGLAHGGIPERRALLRQYVAEVVVDGPGEARVSYRLPF